MGKPAFNFCLSTFGNRGSLDKSGQVGSSFSSMADEGQTKPMLETLLLEMRAGFTSIEKRFEKVEARLEKIETRMDRIESMVLELRADFRDLRTEFNEFRSQFKQPA